MAQEIEHVNRSDGLARGWAGRMSSLLWSRVEEAKSSNQTAETVVHDPKLSRAILSALGDESSRKILTSAIVRGKTVEEISAEQGLPLSTCYRRIRHLVSEGLMILERMVVTPTGKRYAVYRTTFSKAAIRFDGGEIVVEAMPNSDVLDKLRKRWLSANYPSQNQNDRRYDRASARPNLIGKSIAPFE